MGLCHCDWVKGLVIGRIIMSYLGGSWITDALPRRKQRATCDMTVEARRDWRCSVVGSVEGRSHESKAGSRRSWKMEGNTPGEPLEKGDSHANTWLWAMKLRQTSASRMFKQSTVLLEAASVGTCCTRHCKLTQHLYQWVKNPHLPMTWKHNTWNPLFSLCFSTKTMYE